MLGLALSLIRQIPRFFLLPGYGFSPWSLAPFPGLGQFRRALDGLLSLVDLSFRALGRSWSPSIVSFHALRNYPRSRNFLQITTGFIELWTGLLIFNCSPALAICWCHRLVSFAITASSFWTMAKRVHSRQDRVSVISPV